MTTNEVSPDCFLLHASSFEPDRYNFGQTKQGNHDLKNTVLKAGYCGPDQIDSRD
ncbi:hypothetical protein [Sulfuriferula sp.]